MNHTPFRIAASGLEPHEQRLLAQQLKMLKGKTRYEWHYVGQDAEADIVLIRNQASASTRATVALGGDPAVNGNQARREIEWPLRLFGLLELLSEAEEHRNQNVTAAPVKSLSARLSSLRSFASLKHGDVQLAFSPSLDVAHGNVADFETLVDALSALPTATDFGNEQSVLAAATSEYSLKRLIWAIALREPAEPLPAAGTVFKINSWPNFSEWQSSPAYLRLAALYSRQYASVEQGAAFSNSTVDEVAAFLRACERCALGLTVRSARPPQPAAIQPPPADSPPLGLLQRLRRHLGIGFQKGE